MKSKKLISSLAPLKPLHIIDAQTGEIITQQEHDKTISQLINYTQKQVQKFYKKNSIQLELDLLSDQRSLKPAEWARQNNYKLDTSNLPREVKAKSRIEKLYQHKLITEVLSYVNNPNPLKNKPVFSQKINLGSVDKQMISLDIENDTLLLNFKAWNKHYLLTFQIPNYILQRNIIKWSLPTIELRNNIPYYIFSIQEKPLVRLANHNNHAGLDLGRVEPFTMVITNKHNKRIADYTVTRRIKQLNDKRERILKEKSHILKKIDQYDKLGLDSSILRIEVNRKSAKALLLGDEVAKQVGADVTKKLKKHDVSVLAVEDLSWVHGAKYGSKWVHSKLQDKIKHSLSRVGVSVKKVNPKNTSQVCHVCGSIVVHNSKTRIVKCVDCKRKFDRDFNAAMNIVRKLKRYPNQKSRIGDDYRNNVQIIEYNTHNSVLKKPSTTRMGT